MNQTYSDAQSESFSVDCLEAERRTVIVSFEVPLDPDFCSHSGPFQSLLNLGVCSPKKSALAFGFRTTTFQGAMLKLVASSRRWSHLSTRSCAATTRTAL